MEDQYLQKDEVDISVVIPAYNEANRISKTLLETSVFLESSIQSYEIIVVDDGSEDGTVSVVREFFKQNQNVNLLCLGKNQGKGAAVRAGVREAKGRYIIYLDADGSSRIDHMKKLVQAIQSGADVAIGSRISREGDDTRVIKHWYRHLMGQIFNLVVSILAIGGIDDTQCGFKMFRRSVAKTVFRLQKLKGFAFDVEILYLCRKHGYRVVEIPIDWIDISGSKVRLIKDSIRMLLNVCQIRFLHRHTLPFPQVHYQIPVESHPVWLQSEKTGKTGL